MEGLQAEEGGREDCARGEKMEEQQTEEGTLGSDVEDEEEKEELMVVKEVKKDQEVEMEEEKEVGGAVGPTGLADLRTTKVKAIKKS